MIDDQEDLLVNRLIHTPAVDYLSTYIHHS